ncbi:macrolide family glycosyltransferase [Plantactinospora sp. KBS50]|uniref:macrolide family glycosyltransferase n=1 Tax=Plantactinospora sp. KBS50 TaxID=2024580 RepID=UPI0012FE2FDD|nr:macrolide family glycosyltransferase [Plantactinospora sp. KBS50]
MPSHFLFISIPDPGRLSPHLAIGKELVRRGHSVKFVTVEPMAALVGSYGVEPLVYGSAYGSIPVHEEKEMSAEAAMLALSVDDSAAMIDAVEAAYGDERPDLIAYDVASGTAGRVLARKWGLPAAQLYADFAQNDEFAYTQPFDDDGVALGEPLSPAGWAARSELKPWVDRTERLLTAHGLTDVTFAELLEVVQEFNLVYVPKALQPAADSFDDRFRFVGPCVGEQPARDDWQPPADGLPVVLVPSAPQGADLARAFVGAPVHVVLTPGPGADPASLSELPPNVEVHASLPQGVLRHAAVVVSQGDVGNVTEALAAGRPVVVVPPALPARITGFQLAKLGLGRLAAPDGLRDAVLDLIGDRAVAERLAWMRGEIEAAGGVPRAADELEAHAAR